MKNNQIDTFLSCLELNRKKEKVLNQMKELEFSCLEETEAYQKWIFSYQTICYLYQKKLLEISNPNELLTNFKDLNPHLFQPFSFAGIFLEENATLKKTLLDVQNIPLLQLYSPANKMIFKSPVFAFLSSVFHFDVAELVSSEEELSTDLLNAYMNHDFWNFCFFHIQKELQKEKDFKHREELLTWKYQLILLSKEIETRMLQTNFSLPDTVNFLDEISIQTAGIDVEEYLKLLDGTCITLIEQLMNICMNPTMPTDHLFLYQTLLSCLSELLNDKEYCDLLQDELKEKFLFPHDHPLVELGESINHIFEQSKKQQKNTKENRQYFKI